jgi:branched-subunit amino acid transport protein
MSAVWWSVLLVGVGTVLLKSAGPVLLGGRTLPPALGGMLELLAPAVLAALVVTQLVGGDRELVFDERLAGVAAAAVALALRAPILVVVAVAAVTTAVLRLVL